MIPYDLIVTASHRPTLLGPTLRSLLAQVDQPPARLLIHDDAVPPFLPTAAPQSTRAQMEAAQAHLLAAREVTKALLLDLNPPFPVVYTVADPPRKLGLALRWLLDNVQTEYVLYSQDDFVTVRPVPIQDALKIMDQNALHQIRFNKRATLQYKETWQGRWTKEEREFEADWPIGDGQMRIKQTLTISDHFYFQTGLWRVQPIRTAVRWLTHTRPRLEILAQGLAEHYVNEVFNGTCGYIPGLRVPAPEESPQAPETRARVQRTFIWGSIGEDRYIRHIGGAHPTAAYPRDGGVDDPACAWREIAQYPPPPDRSDA